MINFILSKLFLHMILAFHITNWIGSIILYAIICTDCNPANFFIMIFIGQLLDLVTMYIMTYLLEERNIYQSFNFVIRIWYATIWFKYYLPTILLYHNMIIFAGTIAIFHFALFTILMTFVAIIASCYIGTKMIVRGFRNDYNKYMTIV
jgi:hypothetical protein